MDDNNKEWRDLILYEVREVKNDVKEIKKEMITLKLKVAAIAASIGGVVGGSWKAIINLF